MKTPRPIYVEWDDHILHAGTFDKAQLSALKLAFQRTVGWLVAEDDEVLCVAQSIHELDEYEDVLLVSKSMLRKRKFLDGV